MTQPMRIACLAVAVASVACYRAGPTDGLLPDGGDSDTDADSDAD